MYKNSTSKSSAVATSPSPPRVPVELQEMVIDSLRNNKDALSCCALVCRSWQALSQTYLFSSLLLYSNDCFHNCSSSCISDSEPLPGQPLDAVKDFLVGTPRIGAYIQEIRFVGPACDNEHILKASLLLNILKSAPRLRIMEFHSLLIWDDFPTNELKDNILAFLSAFPCLKQLVFNTTILEPGRSPPITGSSEASSPPSFPSPPRSFSDMGPSVLINSLSLSLESLEFIEEGSYFSQFEQVLAAMIVRQNSFGSLRRITANLDSQSPMRLRRVARIIEVFGPRLDELCIDLSAHGYSAHPDFIEAFSGALQPVCLPAYKSLSKFSVRIHLSDDYSPSCFAMSTCLTTSTMLQLLLPSVTSPSLVLVFDVVYLQETTVANILSSIGPVEGTVLSADRVKTVTLTTSGWKAPPIQEKLRAIVAHFQSLSERGTWRVELGGKFGPLSEIDRRVFLSAEP
ncbi:uncharacterized protein PHACADRAFT_207473 [Phanerochaete carnosa HHB-10118-sp]|uniref:F-box domain-containing protein n=1 Tax=Phanerochaete carnosa (strain HHB-10118-sp) TaxID=650164 RepID=K5WHT7_PHACS|nr:uncharacterized protein PHACADRAFT_207473 [Phanerochaete carnosa HHB-10118-sp]EKM58684.1 hypothetical protein PHACADRAFT_207473 [Phanerochaete carnosa HHB-10118-sp]